MKYTINLNGHAYEVEVELAAPMTMADFNAYAPAAPEEPVPAAVPAAAPAANAPSVEGEAVTAPMPGNILKVLVAAGQTVKEGDILVILEAMKMENEIVAPKNGTVTQVLVEKGTTVDTDAPLVFLR